MNQHFQIDAKICAIQSKFKILTTLKKRFVVYLQIFSKKYVNVRNYIDVENDFDFDIAIQKVQKKNSMKNEKKRHVNKT